MLEEVHLTMCGPVEREDSAASSIVLSNLKALNSI